MGTLPERTGDEGVWWDDGTINDWGAVDYDGTYVSQWTGWRDCLRVCRVGAERSGRILDGVEHLALPEGL